MTSVANTIIRPPFVANAGDGTLAFEIVEPWYRSLPVSCITGLGVSVDGAEVPAERLSIEIDGVVRSIGECADAWDRFWFIQDPAIVRVADVAASAGDEVSVEVALSLRIPYIMVGPDRALPRHVASTATFEVSAA